MPRVGMDDTQSPGTAGAGAQGVGIRQSEDGMFKETSSDGNERGD